eukprot:TRINITY_DN4157_c0_g1_i1.p1 TRINITY_DN4157_c0_g1~~TRINITY_DN4157_c0_g1_i1.p1  ORF type:complete len:443 (-),score=79.33 TRINITY_DN4157_c0_g1_i1:31-1359(-)
MHGDSGGDGEEGGLMKRAKLLMVDDQAVLQLAHQAIDLAKTSDWDKLYVLLSDHPGLVNVWPEVREYSVLHQASWHGAKNVAEKLVREFGALVALPTKSNTTAADVATERGHLELAESLRALQSEQESVKVDLSIRLMSGGSLFSIVVTGATTGAEVCKAVSDQGHVRSGTFIQTLMVNGSPLQGHEPLAKNVPMVLAAGGLKAEAQVVLGRLPALHVFKPCTVLELSKGVWSCGGDSDEFPAWGGSDEFPAMVDAGAPALEDIQSAPEEARCVAESMRDAFRVRATQPGKATDRPLIADGADVTVHQAGSPGEIFVIANPGEDKTEACLRAFHILREWEGDDGTEQVWELARVADIGLDVILGRAEKGVEWNCEIEEDEPGQPDRANPAMIRGLKVMAASLTQGFIFEIDSDSPFDSLPIMYAGFANDGSIVGVVSTWGDW